MASKGSRTKGSNRSQVLAYLREHEGHHRCTEIAEGTGLTTHQVAIAARGLAEETGDAVRGLRPAANGRRPFHTYAAAPETVGASGKNEHSTNPPPNN